MLRSVDKEKATGPFFLTMHINSHEEIQNSEPTSWSRYKSKSYPLGYVLHGICLLRVLVREEVHFSKKYNDYKRSVA